MALRCLACESDKLLMCTRTVKETTLASCTLAGPFSPDLFSRQRTVTKSTFQQPVWIHQPRSRSGEPTPLELARQGFHPRQSGATPKHNHIWRERPPD